MISGETARSETYAELLPSEHRASVLLPMFITPVSAGFPLPAEDYIDTMFDLNEYLIGNKSATFLLRVRGNSMCDVGIYEGSILVVDKSIEPADGNIVIAIVNGEFLVKIYKIQNSGHVLMAANKNYAPIVMGEGGYIWGVATNCINDLL